MIGKKYYKRLMKKFPTNLRFKASANRLMTFEKQI